MKKQQRLAIVATMALVMSTGGVLPIITSADGAVTAVATNASANVVQSSTVSMVAVLAASSPNTQSPLSTSVSHAGVAFYVVNFGSRNISDFTISQDGASATLRYCVSGFTGNVSSKKCRDNSTPVVLATSAGAFAVHLATAIAPGSSLEFSVESKTTNTENISVQVPFQ